MRKIFCSIFFTSTLLFNASAQDTSIVNSDTVTHPGNIATKVVSDGSMITTTTNATSVIQFAPTQKTSVDKKPARYPSPYKTSWKVDGPITIGGIGLTVLGVTLIENKRDATLAELRSKTRDKLPFFDRGNAGYYSEKADKDSYIPFQYSFGLPVLLALVNKNERHSAFQVLALYTETMAVTGALFTMATGNVYRSRPYVYDPLFTNGADTARRLDNDSHRSFYAGHTAATAAATFFAAQAFADFNPDSKLKPVIWVVAAATPAVVGYLRYKAGMHFLSDNILGYALGAAAGIYVPKLHRIEKLKNLSFVPQAGKNYKGIAFAYKF